MFDTDSLTYVPPRQRVLLDLDIHELQRRVRTVLEPMRHTEPDVAQMIEAVQREVNVWALERVREPSPFERRSVCPIDDPIARHTLPMMPARELFGLARTIDHDVPEHMRQALSFKGYPHTDRERD